MSTPQHRSTAGPARPEPAQEAQESTAAGIYGIIVSAAVMAAVHAPSVVTTVVAVLVTLTIYWAAERYARIVAERIHEGHRPAWTTVREQLTSGWEMITASTFPLVVLVVVRLTGAELRIAVLSALACSTILLCMAGWRVGAHGRLTRREQLVSTVVAGLFGAALVLLKALLH